jgi:1D-myo-inositol-tetrakisphosphate 5-kinase/inositol-polyphosphate multikinase
VRAALEEFVGCRGNMAGRDPAADEPADEPTKARGAESPNRASPAAASSTDADVFADVAVADAESPKLPKPSGNPSCRASEVFGEALTQLSGLRAWFATQRELHLLGSSVLIVYEGDAAAATRRTRVCVIDFCNYVDARGELDDNFASGLDRLAEMMRSIVDAEEGQDEASEAS